MVRIGLSVLEIRRITFSSVAIYLKSVFVLFANTEVNYHLVNNQMVLTGFVKKEVNYAL